MKLRTTLQSVLAVLLAPFLFLIPTACNQNTVAALVTTLGNASASIADIEGNTALAARLQTDTQAAAAAVLAWKQGTPAQNVVQALGIVQADLNLICSNGVPCTNYEPLITLSLGTITSIIEIVNPGAAPTMTANVAGTRRTVHLTNPPKTAKDFSKQWNAICNANPALAQAVIH